MYSDYSNKLGERVTIVVYQSEMISYWNTPFGSVYLYKFIDAFNNIFIWKTSRFYEGEINILKGTIKDYCVYNGMKEIVLTYCKPV